jgi:excisionase family DNA binding protein
VSDDRPSRQPVLVPLAQQPPYLTVRQAAGLLCVSPWVLYQAIRFGDLPVIRWGRRVVIDRDDLTTFVEGKRDPGFARSAVARGLSTSARRG